MAKEWRLVGQTPNSVVHELYIDGKPIGLFKSEFPALPIIHNTDFEGLVADGYVEGKDASYPTARSTSWAYTSTDLFLWVGQMLWTGNYYCARGFLKFDTSGIPDSDVIPQVNLTMTVYTDYSDTDFDLQIIKQDWSAQDPLSDANREAAYDNCLAGAADNSIWRNTAGIAVNIPYTSGNLSTVWVNKAGNTYYSLRSKHDFDNIEPIGYEHVQLYAAEYGTAAHRPILTVLHAASQAAKIGGVDFADIAKIHGVDRDQVLKIKGITL